MKAEHGDLTAAEIKPILVRRKRWDFAEYRGLVKISYLQLPKPGDTQRLTGV